MVAAATGRLAIGLLILGLIGASAAAQEDGARAILAQILRVLAPDAAWDTATTVTGDITCDGRTDAVMIGYAADAVWIGLVPSQSAVGEPKPTALRFPIDRGDQGGFCAKPVRLELDALVCEGPDGALPGCAPIAGCLAVSAHDDECDGFHFFWDGDQRALRWWRN